MSDDNEIPVEESRKDRLARLASVRSRATSLDLSALADPDPNMHYELVHHDDISITKKKMLGFEFVREQKLLAKHGSGETNVIGDTVLMQIPKDVKRDYDYLAQQDYKTKFGRQTVERDIIGGTAERGEPLPDGLVEEGTTVADTTRVVSGREVKSQLGKG